MGVSLSSREGGEGQAYVFCAQLTSRLERGLSTLRSSTATEDGQAASPSALSRRPLKKPPGEDTGPTTHADSHGMIVGRVPSRGEQDLFEQTANSQSPQ